MTDWDQNDRADLERLAFRDDVGFKGVQAHVGCSLKAVYRWVHGENEPIPRYQYRVRQLFKRYGEDGA